MKTKNNYSPLILSSVICLLPLVLSFAVYNDLPELIAVHWDFSGNPDNFVPKAVAAFGLPFLFLAINLFSKIRLYNDPKRAAASKAMQLLASWTPPVLSIILIPITLFIAMGVNIPIPLIASVIVGVILMISGNYLPKSRQNYTIGIKLPWTLHDADNWNKTHRMAGYLWILGGIVLIAGTFISHKNEIWGVSLTLIILLLLIIIPVIYSYLLYRKNGNSQDDY